MSISLNYKGRHYLIGSHAFIVGRNDDCDLTLSDPLASRRHAAFYHVGAHLVVEDLNSRNGVQVNGKSVKRVTELTDGDEVVIAEQRISIDLSPPRLRTDTLIRTPDGLKSTTFGILGSLADKALQLGQGEEGERIVGRLLEDILSQAEAAANNDNGSPLANETFVQSIQFAMKIAELTQKGHWVDYVFRLYEVHNELMDADTVNELYSVIPRTRGASVPTFRQYIESLTEREGEYTPGERFVLRRLEGIEALL